MQDGNSPTIRIYIRVSTERQMQFGTSFEEQERQCRQEAELKHPGAPVVLYVDNESAFRLPLVKRDAGFRLICDARPGDTIICMKLDRMFRTMVDAVDTMMNWMNMGVNIRMLDIPFCDSLIMSKLIIAMIGWCAEFESHRRGERVAESNRVNRMKGIFYTASVKAPMGFNRICRTIRLDSGKYAKKWYIEFDNVQGEFCIKACDAWLNTRSVVEAGKICDEIFPGGPQWLRRGALRSDVLRVMCRTFSASRDVVRSAIGVGALLTYYMKSGPPLTLTEAGAVLHRAHIERLYPKLETIAEYYGVRPADMKAATNWSWERPKLRRRGL